MNLSLLLPQCPTCLVHLTCMVCEKRGRWPHNCYFLECCFQDLFKAACSILVQTPSSFFSMHFIIIHVVHLFSSIDITTVWKKSHFILLERSDFYMIDNLPIAVYAFARWMVKSLSVDEMLLQKYVNWSTDFRSLPLKVKMAPSCLKHMNCVLFVITLWPVPPAACFRLFNMDSAEVGVFTRSTRSSV